MLGRAVFGFMVETHDKDFFIKDKYVESLGEVENKLLITNGKTVLYALVFSVFSLLTANSLLDEVTYSGFHIARIPFLTELCILVLGVQVTAIVIGQLNHYTINQMRLIIFANANSEVPHMRMVHMKGSGAWIDVLTPKYRGYSSGCVQNIITAISLFWMLPVPITLISVPVVAQIICFMSVGSSDGGLLSISISLLGLSFSGLATFIFIVVLVLPLPFHLKTNEDE